jgi:hypothetical protein
MFRSIPYVYSALCLLLFVKTQAHNHDRVGIHQSQRRLRRSQHIANVRSHFPHSWSRRKKSHVLSFILLHSASSRSRLKVWEPQEDANPNSESWGKAYGKPFSGADAGGGDEPEINYDYETNGENGGTSIDPTQKACTKQTGMYLQGCVYVSNQHLDANKKALCANQVSQIGAECVFGPVKGKFRL